MAHTHELPTLAQIHSANDHVQYATHQEVWLHFRRTDAGLYEAATQGFCLHEGATPGRFLMSAMSERRRRFHVAVRRRLARLFGRVGSC